ncbi:helix-turn-helix domain-containing protein [Leifsonia xyli]|uniref:helix-turn-helix domain-containing protein n=1 Tax=Leifsonia xyli TaxID=1575 RepID=UPI003D67EA83
MAANNVIARNVRRFREERGLSLGELGRRAGLAKQTIASIETGTGNPTIVTVESLASALGVTSRALLTELGTEILVNPGSEARWHTSGNLRFRGLDESFGSGYVVNSLLRLDSSSGVSRHPAGSRGTLRHCFVIEGQARLGPESEAVFAEPGDFVRFPGDVPHTFKAISVSASIFVCTTSPQLPRARGDRTF